MTVAELIKKLEQLPQGATVGFYAKNDDYWKDPIWTPFTEIEQPVEIENAVELA